MKLYNIIAASVLISTALASCSKDDDAASNAINPSYSVFVNGVKIVSADMQNSSPESKEVEVTQYDNVSFCSSSANVSAAKWVISSEQNSIEAEEDTLHMQFPNADDVYNNISLSLTGISAGQKMNLSVPVTFNVKSFEYPGSGEGENPSVTDEPYDILGENNTTSMLISDDMPDVVKIDLGGDLDFKLMPYSTKGFTVTSTPSSSVFSMDGNSSLLVLKEVRRSQEDGSVLELKLEQAVTAGVDISVAYDGTGDLMFINGKKLAAFDTAEHPDNDVENNVLPFTSDKLNFVIENNDPDLVVITFKEEQSASAFADGITSEGLSVNIDGEAATISSITMSDDKKCLKLQLAGVVKHGDKVTISYDGDGNIALNSGTKLESFNGVDIVNNVKMPEIEISSDMISFYNNSSVMAISIKPGLPEGDSFKTPTNLINNFELYANERRANIRSVNINNNNINVILPVAITANDIIKLKFNGQGLETTNGFAVSPFEFDDLKYEGATNTSVFDPFMHGFERYLQTPGVFQVSNFAILGWSVATNVGKETNSPVKYETLTEGTIKNMVLTIDNEGNISSKGQIYFMPKTDGGQVVSFPKAGNYKLKFRYKINGTDSQKVKMTFNILNTENESINTKFLDIELTNISEEFQNYESDVMEFLSDLTNYKFNFAKNAIPDGAKIYIDDIQLIPVNN